MTTYNRRNNFTSYKRSKYDFCKENLVDYKDASLLRKFITDRGRIDAGIKSGNSAKCHREVTKAIKRARYLALLPYAPQHEKVTGPVKIFELIKNLQMNQKSKILKLLIQTRIIRILQTIELQNKKIPLLTILKLLRLRFYQNLMFSNNEKEDNKLNNLNDDVVDRSEFSIGQRSIQQSIKKIPNGLS